MDFKLTDDQIDLQMLTRDFVNKELIPIVAEYDRKGEFPMEVYNKAVEIGINCLDLPVEFGGPGLDYMTTAIVREELSRGDAGFSSSLGANSLGLKPLLIAGNKEQQKHYADIVSSGGFLAFGLTEPNAGSDAAAVQTTAVKVGDEYILNGRKCFITNAKYAGVITIIASTDKSKGHAGLSMFMVDAGTPGLSIGKEEDKMGIRLSSTSDVILEDVKIPAKNLIGAEGQAFEICMKTVDRGRANAGASAVGLARAALEYSVKYAQERIAFGQPIRRQQMIQQMIADMATNIEAARRLVWAASYAIDTNSPEITKLGAMAKCFASDVAVKVTSDAVQIHGGYGYMRDYPVEKLFRDAKIFQIFEGTNQIQRIVIARSVINENRIPKR